jgi:hypothetical protein
MPQKKLDYWKNRQENRRGQGKYPITAVLNAELSKPRSNRPRGVRKAVYRAGKDNLPLYDPNSTNHSRMLERKAKREASRATT